MQQQAIIRVAADHLKVILVWFGLVYFFIHSVTHVTLDTSITDSNLYITTQLTIYGHPPNIIQ